MTVDKPIFYSKVYTVISHPNGEITVTEEEPQRPNIKVMLITKVLRKL